MEKIHRFRSPARGARPVAVVMSVLAVAVDRVLEGEAAVEIPAGAVLAGQGEAGEAAGRVVFRAVAAPEGQAVSEESGECRAGEVRVARVARAARVVPGE